MQHVEEYAPMVFNRLLTAAIGLLLTGLSTVSTKLTARQSSNTRETLHNLLRFITTVASLQYVDMPRFQKWRKGFKKIFFIGLALVCFYLITTFASRTPIIGSTPKTNRFDDNWPLRVTKMQQGNIELSLEYRLDSSNGSVELTVQDTLVMSHGARGRFLTFRDLERIPDSQWKEYIPSQAYLVYPQPLNLVETVDKLMTRRPIAAAPLIDAVIRFYQHPKSVCNPDNPESSNYDVVIVVKSGIANFEKRQLIRKIISRYERNTSRRYKTNRVGLVFSIGRPRTQEDNLFDFRGREIRLVGRGGQHLNPDSLRKVRADCAKEMKEYTDLLVGDYEDTYFNLTVKMVHSFTWAATFCRHSRPDLVFIDDDDKADLQKVIEIFLKTPKGDGGSLLHGYLKHNEATHRFGLPKYEHWAVFKDEVPWAKYPTYASGKLLIASFVNVERLALGMFFTKQFHTDDCWLAIVITKLGLHLKHINKLFG